MLAYLSENVKNGSIFNKAVDNTIDIFKPMCYNFDITLN